MHNKPKWKCPECGSTNVRFMVGVIIAAPMDFFMNLSKENMRKKEVEIWGASWPTMDIYCKECGKGLWLPREKAPEHIFQDVLERIARGESTNPAAEALDALVRADRAVDQSVSDKFEVPNAQDTD